MHKIVKEFQCDYGHRVWNQKLDKDLAGGDYCKCKHLHGHRMVVGVELVDKSKDPGYIGMVTDFNHLNWFKQFLDEVIDHKFLLDVDDPFCCVWSKLMDDKDIKLYWKKEYLPDYNIFVFRNYEPIPDGFLEFQYVIDSFVILPFVPTSENLAKWFHQIISEKMDIECSRVYVKETPSSLAEYVEE